MLDLGFLRIGIKADTDEAKAKLKSVQEELGKTESKSKASAAQIESAQKSLNGAFGALAKTAALAGAAVGTAFLATGKAALDAYANYEQLTGGVETLFKESSNIVMNYAGNAYKTAGMSANQYMETITGFSASLLQSLGGDTKKAAQIGNQAVIDMSDNANKMGTSMELIQNAYQGFAKANFTMLDNLKLGYGGTKEEMERLIQDANRVKEANGEMADLSIDSFADITEAIHIIQTEMGITGTTTKEAASTIEGSINMMRGAWSNWLVGLGDSEAEMGELTASLIESVVTVMKNVVPRVKEIFKSLVAEIPYLFEEIKAQMPQHIQDIISVFESMVPAIATIAATIGGMFVGNALAQAPALIAKITGAAQGLFALISANPIIGVVAAIAGVTAALVGLYNTNEEFRAKVDEMVSNLIPLVQTGIQVIQDAFSNFVAVVAPLIQPLLDVLQTAFMNLCDVVFPALQTVLSAIIPFISMVVSAFIDFGTQVAAAVLPVITQVIDLFNQFCIWVTPLIQQALEVVKGIFDSVFPAIEQVITSVFNQIQSVIQTAMGVIQGIIKVVTGIIKGDWSQVWEGIKQIASSIWNRIKNTISNAINIISGIIQAVLGTIKGIWNGAWNAISSFLSGVWDTMKSTVSNAINGVVDFFRNMPSRILSALGNVGNLLVNAGEQIIDGFLNGLKSAFGNVQDFVGGIGEWIAAHKGPKEYDLKLLIPNGGWIMESLATGLKKAMPEVQKALDSVAGEIKDYNFGSATVEADFNAYKGMKASQSKSNKANAGRGNETTIVVNNYSPKALTEKESARQFRQSARQLAFA